MTKKRIYKMLLIDGKTISEHRYVMEQHIGRKLQKNEVVHHINHDHRDNRIENLMIMDPTSHAKYHCTLSNHGKWTRDSSHSKCKDCGTNERPHYMNGMCERCVERKRLIKRREYNKESCRKRYYANRRKRLDQLKKYYQDNPDKLLKKREYYRQYRIKHAKALYKKARERIARNPEITKAYMKAYRLSHPKPKPPQI